MLLARQVAVPAKHDQLAKLAKFVVDAAVEAGFDQAQINRIELAVDEACSNIIDHAYAGRPGMIQLSVQVETKHYLTIIVVDQGKPFNPEKIPSYIPSNTLEETRIGGLGIHLMRRSMDDVKYEFNIPGVGNRLTMTKHL